MKTYWYSESPVGPLGIAEADGSIVQVFFAHESEKENQAKQVLHDFEKRETPLIKKCTKQLKEYFVGKRRDFDLPLSFEGTDFQKKVWAALLTIPYGETRTYGDIAKMIGNPKGPRAVGMANNRNPIAIICPCHRVIGANGALIGYASGLDHKKYLLELESGKDG